MILPSHHIDEVPGRNGRVICPAMRQRSCGNPRSNAPVRLERGHVDRPARFTVREADRSDCGGGIAGDGIEKSIQHERRVGRSLRGQHGRALLPFADRASIGDFGDINVAGRSVRTTTGSFSSDQIKKSVFSGQRRCRDARGEPQRSGFHEASDRAILTEWRDVNGI